MVSAVKLIGLLFLVLAPAAYGELTDPTRPPAAWLESTTGPIHEDEVTRDFRLQSVLMPYGGRPVAIIGGKTVALGGRIGEVTLIRLNEREAVLQGADGVTHLYLTPDVRIQMIVMPTARSTENYKVGKVFP